MLWSSVSLVADNVFLGVLFSLIILFLLVSSICFHICKASPSWRSSSLSVFPFILIRWDFLESLLRMLSRVALRSASGRACYFLIWFIFHYEHCLHRVIHIIGEFCYFLRVWEDNFAYRYVRMFAKTQDWKGHCTFEILYFRLLWIRSYHQRRRIAAYKTAG